MVEFDCNAKTVKDARGWLSVLEMDGRFPLRSVKRIYWIDHVPSGGKRGGHAHRDAEQVFVCLQGVVTHVIDGLYDAPWSMSQRLPGLRTVVSVANSDQAALYVPPMAWHTMTFIEENTIVLVLSSEFYDESEYIRDVCEFRRLMKALSAD